MIVFKIQIKHISIFLLKEGSIRTLQNYKLQLMEGINIIKGVIKGIIKGINIIGANSILNSWKFVAISYFKELLLENFEWKPFFFLGRCLMYFVADESLLCQRIVYPSLGWAQTKHANMSSKRNNSFVTRIPILLQMDLSPR